jgi:eukaryotic-like serine/threonine-protein kinase
VASRDTARRFHFLREIASGGFGNVYLAKELHNDGFSRLVAVKLLKAQWTDSIEVTARIRDEARLLGLLRHRNIVDVMDLTSLDGRAAVIMEYLEAVDLRVVTDHLKEVGEVLPLRAALDIAAAVAGALDAAYNRPPIPGDKPLRVIHRDIKPSNIMVDEHGHVKVLDFGVARSEIENRESHTQELQFGSVDYMAPERLFFEPETPASDVYSLGVTLFEILNFEKFGKARGRPEVHEARVEQRLADLRMRPDLRGAAAGEAEALLRSALAYNHEKRPSSAEFFQRARALARLCDGDDAQQWAERVLPGLIKTAADAPRPASPLTDSILTEDSLAFVRADDSGARPVGGVMLRPGQAVAGTALSGPAALGPTAADVLQRGALAELDGPSGPQVPPAAPRWAGEEELAGPVALDDIPSRSPVPIAAPATGAPRRNELGAALEERPTTMAGSGLAAPPPPLTQAPAPAAPRPTMRGLGVVEPWVAAPRDDVQERPTEFAPPSTRIAASQPVSAPPRGAPDAPVRPSPPSRPAPSLQPDARPGPPPRREPEPVAVQRPRPPVHQQADEDEDEGGRGGAMAGAMAVVGCLAAGLLVGAVATVLLMDVGGLRTMLVGAGSADEVTDTPAEPAEPLPTTTATGAGSDAAPGAALHFVSVLPGTRKLSVQCKGGSGKGETEATVALAASETCTVTAILEDRSREVAIVNDVQAGSMRCFEGGEARCVAQ